MKLRRDMFLCMMLFYGTLWGMDGEKQTDISKSPKNMENDYGALRRPDTLSLGHIQDVWTTAPPCAGIYKIDYQKDHVIRLKTRPFMTTTIVLPEWEEISDIFLGDDHLFIVEKKNAYMVCVLAKEEGCDTSLTLIGKSGNIYPFYVRSEGIHSSQVPDIVVYVEKKGMRERILEEVSGRKEEADYLQTVPFSIENLTFLFEMFQKDFASQEIAPVRVYSDGIWTWLDYGNTWDKKPFPAVYQRIDGVDTPVNTRVEGSKIIVHGLPPLTLKSGQKVICIEKMEL
ncbi:MAG: hypothetical protein B7Y25_01285 [Alphaproteobacteria bacterium 16-39-46]|nr:MAG: hypothetical protein B7Y25_01285 [Alphaproteobacteria bacterium 16-39-46]OZA44125.1 MAG: hypothetical protein B7X84_01195 [Alphaproteobacteria bacterium 17-39-52]HQS83531.1 TrbG/VirB9 family P-type conjugative transfer protein [Alphaproteobacteria bacterium]HQS93299.1 TrbG/VirB9 family P-type conjugative transfer protein [Alphaproteobacteria bacterium]